jgi:hypothetical protein
MSDEDSLVSQLASSRCAERDVEQGGIGGGTEGGGLPGGVAVCDVLDDHVREVFAPDHNDSGRGRLACLL